MAISLPDTAFVIACYRANHEEMSCDPYARLWVKPGLQKWVDDFAEKVSEYDEILHCMRNRFFYRELKSLQNNDDKLLCLNLGAGFSMYPFNLSGEMVTIEADFEDVLAYKTKAIATFRENGSLPQRNVSFINADITSPKDQNRLKELLSKYPGYRKVIMIEGVFFFLDHEQIDIVIDFCREIMSPQDVLLTVSFEERTASTNVFHRLTSYFENELHSEGIYTTLPHRFYENLEGFQQIRTDSTHALARQLSLVPEDLEEDEVLNEYCYVLERN